MGPKASKPRWDPIFGVHPPPSFPPAAALPRISISGRWLSPKVLEAIRCQLGIAHRVLDVPMPEPGL
jgi:hypothetical protein